MLQKKKKKLIKKAHILFATCKLTDLLTDWRARDIK